MTKISFYSIIKYMERKKHYSFSFNVRIINLIWFLVILTGMGLYTILGQKNNFESVQVGHCYWHEEKNIDFRVKQELKFGAVVQDSKGEWLLYNKRQKGLIEIDCAWKTE